MLHLDGVLGVGLRVMELAHVHGGLLGLVRGGGLEGRKKQTHSDGGEGKSFQRKRIGLTQYPDRNTRRERS